MVYSTITYNKFLYVSKQLISSEFIFFKSYASIYISGNR